MDLQKSSTVEGKYLKFIPSKQLNDGWHYYEIYGSNLILGIRMKISKVYVVIEKGGEPVIQEGAMFPNFEWQQETETRFLTPIEYRQIKESGYEVE